MTRVLNDPAEFIDEAMEGFGRLHADLVEPVYGGFVRASETPSGKVAVVVGGGSGHYPAFAGWVGPGLADGAVCGNVFTSPSAQQVYSVAKASENGGGVVLTYGNYAGDVLNFTLAQDQLRGEGAQIETVLVTDDVMSSSADTYLRRRGVAGDLVVLKILGAAAEEGYDLESVVAVGRRANQRTVSFGVSFSACTLPGAGDPIFSLPEGHMGVGMGVHGEPAVSEEPVTTSRRLADLLVSRLLQERPDGAGRVAVLVNGLGATKYEELFVLWRDVAELLDAEGLTIVAPEVGELITSLDTAGCSVTLVWLDDELERLWTAPARSAAFSRGAMSPVEGRRAVRATAPGGTSCAQGSPDSAAAATRLLAGMEAVRAELHAHEEDLGRLDAVAGDGDHGRGMCKGIDAACAAARMAVEAGAGIATTLAAAGDAWADRSGGTSGILWGSGLKAAAQQLSDAVAPTSATALAAVVAARDHVLAFGKAQRGDKTMLDAYLPFVDALESRSAEDLALSAAWSEAARVAEDAAQATADLVPRIGRARVTADRSVGHPDPGAVSLALVLGVVGTFLPDTEEGPTHD